MNRITNPYIRHSRIANAAEPQAQLALVWANLQFGHTAALQMRLNPNHIWPLVWANLQFAHSETRICNSEIKNKEE